MDYCGRSLRRQIVVGNTKKMTSVFFLVLILLGGMIGVGEAAAQTPTGTIQGTVTDKLGAVVPNSDVTVRDLATNSLRTAKTDSKGHFEVPLLPNGSYELVVKMASFKSEIVSPITLDVDQTVDLPVVLSTGQSTEVVTVSAGSELLQTSNSSIGQVIGNEDIVELPLANRNIFELDLLVPGVHDFGATSAPATSGSVQFGRFNANGGPTQSSEYMLDGATAVVANLNSVALIPTIDALQQSKIITANIPAEFGRTGGVVFNAVYKTGTNGLHGTLYEFNRNAFMAANSWVNDANHTPKPFSNINTFGFSLGGPVWLPKIFDGRNRLFFAVNYEGYRDITPVNALLTVPTVAQKMGDFSQTEDVNGNLIKIYDPATVLPSGVRTQFANNKIDPSRFDPVGLKLLSYYPDPNVTPTNINSQASNYLTHGSAYNRQNEYSIKLDYNLNERNKLMFRYTVSSQGGGNADYFPNNNGCPGCAYDVNPAGTFSPRGGGAALFVYPKNIAAGYTRIISPNTLFDLHLAYNRQLIERLPQSDGFDLTTIGWNAKYNSEVYLRQFPPITLNNYQGLGTNGSSDLLIRGDNTVAGNMSLTFIRGKHSFKTGVDIRNLRYNETGSTGAITPAFTFGAQWTQLNANTSNVLQGNAVADLLLGLPNTGTFSAPAAEAFQWWYGAGYFQDDWRVGRKVTLNLGIRWGVETPYTDRHNRSSYLDPTVSTAATALVPGALGGIQFPGLHLANRRRYETDINGWDPRLGLAYAATNRIVFHAGYSLTHQPTFTYGFGSAAFGMQGYSSTTAMTVSTDNLHPINTIDDPFPNGFAPPTGNSLDQNTALGTNIVTQLRYGVHTPYIQVYSAGIDQQFGNKTVIGVAWVGSHGVHEFSSIEMNQLTAEQYKLGAALSTNVTNPFYPLVAQGLITSGALASKTVQMGQLLKPFPQFTDVINNNYSMGTMTYNSLQVHAQHTQSKTLSFLGAYTWQKNLGNVGERYNNAVVYQNPYHTAGEEALTPIDVAHSLSGGVVYVLPFGRGQRFGRSLPFYLNAVAGGWQVNGIYQIADGVPLYINQNNTLSFGAQAQRPTRNFNVSLKLPKDQRTPAHYFNTAALTATGSYQYGNERPYEGDLRGPGTNNLKVSVTKNNQVGEHIKLQLRCEYFNVANHPIYAAPGTSLGSTTFGIVSSKTQNRTGQLAGKLIF
jgi:hypothetical protein